MNGYNRHPFRIELQAVMLAEQHVRELHQFAAQRRLAALAAAAAPPAHPRRFRLLARLRLPLRPALQAPAQ
jgi:hypothetical protein